MREYGLVRSAFWGDASTGSLSDDGKLLALYLLTSAHTSPLGCFRLPDGYLVADLGWTLERIADAFDELTARRFCLRCPRTRYVLIPEFLLWNPIPNPNAAKAREREFLSIPRDSTVFIDLCRALRRFGNHWTKPFETVLEEHPETVSEDDGESIQFNSSQIMNDANASLSPGDDDRQAGNDTVKPLPDKPTATHPPCPAQQLVERYNRICTHLPPAKYEAWSETHRKQLKARWRWLMTQPIGGDPRGRRYAEDPDAAIAWFERLFTHIEQRCPHLTGHNGRGWTASLIWIIGPQNFTKIIEGNYDRLEGGTTP